MRITIEWDPQQGDWQAKSDEFEAVARGGDLSELGSQLEMLVSGVPRPKTPDLTPSEQELSEKMMRYTGMAGRAMDDCPAEDLPKEEFAVLAIPVDDPDLLSEYIRRISQLQLTGPVVYALVAEDGVKAIIGPDTLIPLVSGPMPLQG